MSLGKFVSKFVLMMFLSMSALSANFTSNPSGTNTTGSYSLSWNTSTAFIQLDVYEIKNGGARTKVAGKPSTSVSLSGRGTGSYQYVLESTKRVVLTPGEFDIRRVVEHTISFNVQRNSHAPTGSLNSYSRPQTSVTGSVVDADTPSQAVNVHVWVDGSFANWGWSNPSSQSYSLAIPSNFLTDGQAHTVTMRAKDLQSGVWGFIGGSTTIPAPPAPIPSAPSGLSSPSSIEIGNSAGLTWGSATGQVSRYELYEGGSLLYSGYGFSRNVTPNSLGQHTYRVYACNSSGCGGYASTSLSVVPAFVPDPIPAAPSSMALPSATVAVNSNYTVSWSGASYATSYSLYEKLKSNASWPASPIYSGGSVSYSVPGKPVGDYEYRVKACNAQGCSSYRVGAKAVKVAVLGNGVAFINYPTEEVNDGAYSFGWNPYSVTAPVTKWEVTEQGPTGGELVASSANPRSSLSFTGKATGVYVYSFKITTIQFPGGNPENDPVIAVTTLDSISIAVNNSYDSPVITGPVSGIDQDYTIEWSAVSSSELGSSTSVAAEKYILQEATNEGAWVTVLTSVKNGNVEPLTNFPVAGKAAGQYRYQVKACNLSGSKCSGYSTAVSVGVMSPSSAPLTIASGYLDITLGANVARNVSLPVQGAPSGTTGICVQSKNTSGIWNNLNCSSVQSYGNVNLGDLSAGLHSYRVAACTKSLVANDVTNYCRGIGSTWAGSNVAELNVGRAKVITGVEATRSASFTLDIRAGFDFVQVFENGTLVETLDVTNNRQYNANVTTPGLYNYHVKYCATTSSCPGSISSSHSVLYKPVPGVPTNARVTVDNNTASAYLSWNAPTTGGVTEDYNVQLINSTTNQNVGSATQHGSTDTVLHNLADGSYRFQVSGCNTLPAGQNRACGAATVSPVFTIARLVVIGVPTLNSITPNPSLDGQYTVNWSEVTGGVSSYEAQSQSNTGSGWSAWSSLALSAAQQSSRTYSPATPNANGEYRYQVKACLGSGACGDWSPTQSVVVDIPVVVPVDLGLVLGITHEEFDDGSFEMKWNPMDGATKYRVYDVTEALKLEKERLAALPLIGGEPPELDPTVLIGALKQEVQATAGVEPLWVDELPDGTYDVQIIACDSVKCGPRGRVYRMSLGDEAWAAKGDKPVPDAALVSIDVPEHDPTVGALAGQGSVSGGQASYQIPIKLVPGRNGMQPDVSIGYSSRGGNGPVGMGWSLSAGSSISRCAKIIATDGVAGGVTFDDNNDRLCLDGARLIVVEGAYNQDGAKYRKELDDFTLVIQQGSLSTGHFIAKLKNGRVHTYGGSTDSRHTPAGISSVLRWNISEIQDPSANLIEYIYLNVGSGASSTGEQLLSEIKYTGHGSTSGTRRVEFDYGDQARPDIASRYISGGLIRQTRRLEKIKTFLASDQVREYDFSYKLSRASKRSLLESVQECAFDVSSSKICKPATQMNWLDAKAKFVLEQAGYRQNPTESWKEVTDDPTFLPQYPVSPSKPFYDIAEVMPHGDMNGDGIQDWPSVSTQEVGQAAFSHPGWYSDAEGVYRGQNSSPVGSCVGGGLQPLQCTFADFNQDGRTDSWTNNSSQQLVITYSGSSSQVVTPVNLDHASKDRIVSVADFNGDSWPDIMINEVSSNHVRVVFWHHTGDINAPYSVVNSQVLNLNTNISNNNYDTRLQSISVAGDMNGDGLPDLLSSVQISDFPGFRPHQLLLNTSSPSGSIQFSQTKTLPAADTSDNMNFSRFMDINGDGISDILAWHATNTNEKQLSVSINKGDGNFLPWAPVGGDSSAVSLRGILYSTGVTDNPIESYSVPKYEHAFKSMDYDSDGRQDLLMPTSLVVSTCIKRRTTAANFGRPAVVKEFCGGAITAPYRVSEYVASQSAPVFIRWETVNLAQNDDNVYRYSALKFTENEFGSFDATLEPTDIVASGVHSAASDVSGNGLTDMVFSFGCRRTGDILGSAGNENPKCRIDSKSDQMSDKDPGVYVIRNRGAVENESEERYQPLDMMSGISNGFDVKDEWVYRPLSSQDERHVDPGLPLYSPDFDHINMLNSDAKSKHFHFSSSMYVVAKHSKTNGIGGMNEREYRYKGALYNREGRGFQGFTSITVLDKAAELISKSDFYQVFPLAGKMLSSKTWLLSDIGLSSQLEDVAGISNSDYQWSIYKQQSGVQSLQFLKTITKLASMIPVEAKKHYFVALQKKRTLVRSLGFTSSVNRALISRTAMLKKYDSWGNVKENKSWYFEGTGANKSNRSEKKTTITYENANLDEWWLDRIDYSVTRIPKLTFRTGLSAVTDFTESKKTDYFFTGTEQHRKPSKTVTTATKRSNQAAASSGMTIEYHYSPLGLPLSVTQKASGMDNRVLATSYDSDHYFPLGVRNGLQHITTTEYDSKHGVIVGSTDPNGVSASSNIDAFGRVISVSRDIVPTAYTSLTWCLSGGDCAPNTKFTVTATQAGSPQSSTQIDKLGRTIQSRVEGFDGQWVVSGNTYDELGRDTFSSVPSYGAVSSKGVRYLSYDALGRLLEKQVDQSNNRIMTTSYTHEQGASRFKTDIQVSTTNDSTILNLSRSYNGRKELISTTDALGGTTRYAYNGSGMPVAIEDANAKVIRASYDAFGRKEWVDDPNMGRKDFGYNGFGEVTSESDANGNQLSYQYDQLGRITERSLGGVISARWTFDNASASGGTAYGLLAMEESFSQPLANESGIQELRKFYGYDNQARPKQVTTALDGTSFTTGIEYDANYGRVKAIAYPNRLRLAYKYNERGYQSETTNANSDYLYRRTLNTTARGEWLANTLAAGFVNEGRQIDDATGWVTHVGAGANSSLLLNNGHQLGYVYDGFGNVKEINTNVTSLLLPNGTPQGLPDSYNRTESFEYDVLHRLKTNTVSGLASTSYNYDAAGNILDKSDYANNYQYAGGNNQVTQVTLLTGGTRSYGYDANGNMVNEGGRKTFDYNEYNKPLLITRNNIGGVAQNTRIHYGADLMRFKKQSHLNGEETLYIGKQYEQITAGSEIMHRYYLDGIAVMTETEKTANTPKKQVIGFGNKDRLGSTVAVFDHEGKLKETHSFDPFGKARKSRDSLKPDTTLSSAFSTRGFTDHEHMDNIQMIHMNGRGYDYNLGRFLSVDPFIVDPGNSQALNPYTYILNNPLSGTDPTGYRTRAIDYGNSPGNVKNTNNDNHLKEIIGQTEDGQIVAKTNGGDTVTVSREEVEKGLAGGASGIGSNAEKPNVENPGDIEGDSLPYELPSISGASFNTSLAPCDWPRRCSPAQKQAMTDGEAMGSLIYPTIGTGILFCSTNPLCASIMTASGMMDASDPLDFVGGVRAARSGSKVLQALPDFSNGRKAFEHYAKHSKGVMLGKNGMVKTKPGGADTPEFTSYDAYVSAARSFWSPSSRKGMLQTTRADGATLRFEPSTGYFGVMKNGNITTFYRPDGDGLQYFKDRL